MTISKRIHRALAYPAALLFLLVPLSLLITSTDSAHACYQCSFDTGRARCQSAFFAGSETCAPTVRVDANGNKYDDCNEQGNCVLWILSLDTVNLGSHESMSAGKPEFPGDEGLQELTWVCADDILASDAPGGNVPE